VAVVEVLLVGVALAQVVGHPHWHRLAGVKQLLGALGEMKSIRAPS
jgi:hypothetical protein